MSFERCYIGEVVCLRGRNAALATTLENVSELSTLINWAAQAATAAKLQVSSSAAADKGTPTASTGTRTIRIVGLDGSYNLITEDVTLDGQTQVETTKTFLRVFAAGSLTAGSGGTNAGDIYVIVTGTGGTVTAGVPGTLTSCWIKIPVGFGYGTSGIFTVPLGKKVRLERAHLCGRSQQVDLVIGAQPYGGALNYFQTFALGAPQAMDFVFPLPTSMFFEEKTDIYIRALSATAAGVVTATLFLRYIGDVQRGGGANGTFG